MKPTESHDWRTQLHSYSSSVDNNIKQMQSSRRQHMGNDLSELQRAGASHRMNADILAHQLQGDHLGSQKAELGSLLSAVQSSLADLRIEVATAKRLSSNANAAISDAASPSKLHRVGSSTIRMAVQAVHNRPDSTSGVLSATQSVVPTYLSSYAASPVKSAQMPVPVTSPSAAYAASPRAIQAFYPVDPSVTSEAAPGSVHADQLSRVLDHKMDELGRRLEQQIDKNLGVGTLERTLNSSTALQTVASRGRGRDAGRDGMLDPLVLLGVSKAEAAERSTVHLSNQLTSLEKHYGKDLEGLHKQVADLTDDIKQHWERLCHVTSQVDAMQTHYKSEVSALPAIEHLNRLDNRLMATESTQSRQVTELEEQQRLLLALTTALQKSTKEANASRGARQRAEELSKQLEAGLARVADVENRVSSLSNAVLAHKARELTIGVNSVQAIEPTALAKRLQVLEEHVVVLQAEDTHRKDQSLLRRLEERMLSVEDNLHTLSGLTSQAVSSATSTSSQVTPLEQLVKSLVSRVNEMEVSLSATQSSNQQLRHQLQEVQAANKLLETKLGPAVDKADKTSAQLQAALDAQAERLATAEGISHESATYIERAVRPGLQSMQAQLLSLETSVQQVQSVSVASRGVDLPQPTVEQPPKVIAEVQSVQAALKVLEDQVQGIHTRLNELQNTSEALDQRCDQVESDSKSTDKSLHQHVSQLTASIQGVQVQLEDISLQASKAAEAAHRAATKQASLQPATLEASEPRTDASREAPGVELSALQEQVADIDARVASLGSVQPQLQRIQSHLAQVDSLQPRLDEVQDQVAHLMKIKSDVQSLQTELQPQVQELQAQLQGLEASVKPDLQHMQSRFVEVVSELAILQQAQQLLQERADKRASQQGSEPVTAAAICTDIQQLAGVVQGQAASLDAVQAQVDQLVSDVASVQQGLIAAEQARLAQSESQVKSFLSLSEIVDGLCAAKPIAVSPLTSPARAAGRGSRIPSAPGLRPSTSGGDGASSRQAPLAPFSTGLPRGLPSNAGISTQQGQGGVADAASALCLAQGGQWKVSQDGAERASDTLEDYLMQTGTGTSLPGLHAAEPSQALLQREPLLTTSPFQASVAEYRPALSEADQHLYGDAQETGQAEAASEAGSGLVQQSQADEGLDRLVGVVQHGDVVGVAQPAQQSAGPPQEASGPQGSADTYSSIADDVAVMDSGSESEHEGGATPTQAAALPGASTLDNASSFASRGIGMADLEDGSPTTPPDDASVMDKALYYEKLAVRSMVIATSPGISRQNSPSRAPLPRISRSEYGSVAAAGPTLATFSHDGSSRFAFLHSDINTQHDAPAAEPAASDGVATQGAAVSGSDLSSAPSTAGSPAQSTYQAGIDMQFTDNQLFQAADNQLCVEVADGQQVFDAADNQLFGLHHSSSDTDDQSSEPDNHPIHQAPLPTHGADHPSYHQNERNAQETDAVEPGSDADHSNKLSVLPELRCKSSLPPLSLPPILGHRQLAAGSLGSPPQGAGSEHPTDVKSEVQAGGSATSQGPERTATDAQSVSNDGSAAGDQHYAGGGPLSGDGAHRSLGGSSSGSARDRFRRSSTGSGLKGRSATAAAAAAEGLPSSLLDDMGRTQHVPHAGSLGGGSEVSEVISEEQLGEVVVDDEELMYSADLVAQGKQQQQEPELVPVQEQEHVVAAQQGQVSVQESALARPHEEDQQAGGAYAADPTPDVERGSGQQPGSSGSRRLQLADPVTDQEVVTGSLMYQDDSSETASEMDDDNDRPLPVSVGSAQGTTNGPSASSLLVTAALDESDDEQLEVFAKPHPPGAGSEAAGVNNASHQHAQATGLPAAQHASYILTIKTGTRVGSGISQEVHLTLHGEDGDTTYAVGSQSGHFQRGATDVLEVVAASDLGNIQQLHVWHTGQGFGDSWFLDSVVVRHLSSEKEWRFEVGEWVRGGQEMGRTYNPGGRPGARGSQAGSSAQPSAGGSQQDRHSGAGRVPGANQRPVGHLGAASIGQASSVGSGSVDWSDDDDDLPMFAADGKQPVSTPVAPAAAPRGDHMVADELAHTPLREMFDEYVEDVSTVVGPSTVNFGQEVPSVATLPALNVHTPKSFTAGRPPLPPTPTNQLSTQKSGRSSGGGTGATGAAPATGWSLTAAALGLLDSSMDGSGAITRTNSEGSISLPDHSTYIPSALTSRKKAGRKVRTRGSHEDGSGSEADFPAGSVESDMDSEDNGVESSAASLSGIAPGGVRPLAAAGTRVDYLGTSRKRVSFSEYSEEFDFTRSPEHSEDGSGGAAGASSDGQHDESSKAEVTYDHLLPSRTPGRRIDSGAAGQPSSSSSGVGDARDATSPTNFHDVPLGRGQAGRSSSSNPRAYKIKVFTADKMNAGLGDGTVFLEVLGTDWIISQALPKAKGAFQRGCVDRFLVASQSGLLGDVLAVKLWHEGGSARLSLGGGKWCLHQVQIENRVQGLRYTFDHSDKGGWVKPGKRHAVVLKPRIQRIDELQDLRLVQTEVTSQLQENTNLLSGERQTLMNKLSKIGQMIASLTS